jgi:hypothetical protein
MEASNEPTDPRKYLLEMRRCVLSRRGLGVDKDEDLSLEYLIRITRALVATNEEIWARCAPHYCGKIVDHEAENGIFLFARVAPSTVRALTSSKHKDTLVLQTAVEVTKRDFYLPVNFPSHLCRMVPVPKVSKDVAIPNLGTLLRRSMLLSDDILLIFLMEYKPYLERLQVALGDVEAWLLEATKSEVLLHAHFGASSHPGRFLHAFSNRLLHVDPIQDVSCSRCDKKLSKHTIVRCWAQCSHEGKSLDVCSHPAFFPLTVETNLLICEFRGSMDLRFYIDEARERKRLVKFIGFVLNEKHDAEDSSDSEGSASMGNIPEAL